MHRLLFFTALAGSLAYSAVPQAVAPLEFHAPEQEKLLRSMRQALPSRNHVLPSLQAHTMPALDNNQLKKNATDVRQIGIHRKLEPVAIQNARRDGRIWRLAVQSPGAVAMRLHFTQFAVGAGQVWIHDGGGDEDRVLGPYVGRGPNNDGDFWSATVFSDTVTVEYQPADGQPAEGDVPFTIEEISHQFSVQVAPRPVEQSSASCELDVNCYPDWATTAKGTALLSFEKGGESYGCSGTLMNTRTNSFVPYLLTANHCISTDVVARTLEAKWFYQKSSCNGAPPNQNLPRSVGSTLVATGDKSKGDFTLLKLTSVPNGVTFQGWDPAEQPLGKAVTVIHHPNGDYKRISFGNVRSDITTPPNFYSVQYSAGVTEGGSSGSGLYSAPGILIGSLTNGLASATPDGFCAFKPYSGEHGKFSAYYPLIRNALDGQTADAPSTPPPSGGTNTLTSGEPFTFTLAPVSQPTVLNGKNGFSINVPEGATRLDILMQTTTPNVNVDLYARYGQDVTLNSSGVVADFYSEGPGGVEFLFITRGGTSGLRPGTYYIALGELTTNTEITGKVMAIVATDGTRPPGSGNTPPPSGTGTALSSGAPYDFSVPAVNDPTLFTGTSGFTIDVPQGATRLDVKLTSATRGGDLDLYVTYGEPTSVDEDGIWADYASEGDDSNESIAITAASDPPLKPGTYYIAVASWNPGVKIDATVTATVSTGSAPPPPASGGNVLTSGRAQPFTLDPVTGPTIFTGDSGYRIAVPQGATSLDIVLHTTTANADVDLFARYGQDLAIRNGDIVSDHSSTGETGEERITINASSNPPLRAGTYYISLAAFTAGVRISGTLTATVGTGGGSTPPPAASPTVLTSGTRQTLLFNPVSDPTFFNGNKSYVIDVPANASKLDIQLTSSTAGADMDLFVSYGKDNGVGSDGFIADYGSTGPDGNERITITPDSKPALRPGRYYISIALYTTKTNVLGSLTATVAGGTGGSGQAPAPSGGGTTLTAGQATRFSLPASSAPTLFNGERSFKILAPPSATQMKIQVVSDNPSVDVAVLVRYQAEVGVDAQGHILADYGADGPTGNETLIITNRSTPPLHSGLYYISLVLISTGVPATGTITVTFPDDILSRPNTTGTPMTSGISQSYSLPAVTSPTMFAGSNAYRIPVDRRHNSLRLSLRDNAPDANVVLYVRRGRQPEVIDGSVVADYSLSATGNQDLVLEGAKLRPGVYFITLGQYGTGAASSGTVTATVNPAEPGLQEFQLASAAGIQIPPKQGEEQRFALPDAQATLAHAGRLVKQRNRLKKPGQLKVEVSR